MTFTILCNTETLWQNCVSFLKNIFFTNVSIYGWQLGLIFLLVFAFIILISSRYKSKKSVKKKELTLESITHNVDYSIWVVDKDFQFTFFNEKFKKNTKAIFNKDVFLGQNILDILDNPKEKEYWAPFLRRGLNGEIIEEEATFSNRHFKFSLFPIKIKEKLTSVIVISNEITAQKLEAEKVKTFEKAAAKSETTLQSLVNNIQNSVWAVDTNLCLTFFNENFRRSVKSLYNIDLELGKPLFNDLEAEEKQYWTLNYNKALSGKRINSEVKRSGRTFQFSINPIVVNNEITGVFVISIDLTEKLSQEEAVRRSEFTLNSIVSKINDSFWALDKDLNYTLFNERHKQFIKELFNVEVKIGQALDEKISQEFPDFIKLRDINCLKALKGESSSFEIKFSNNRSFEYFTYPLKAEDEISGVLIFGRDITEKVLQREELKLNEEKYRNLVDTSPTAIIIINVESGLICDANKQAFELFKIGKEDMLKMRLENLSPEYQDDGLFSSIFIQNNIKRACKGENIIFELVQKDNNNNLFPTQIWLNKFPSSNGTFIRCTIIDISESKKQQEKLKDYIEFQTALIGKVKEQEAGLSAIFNSTTDYIYSVDKNLNFIEFNQSFKSATKTRFNIDLERGMSVTNFFVPELKESGLINIYKALAGEPINQILHYINYKNENTYMDISYSPVFSEYNETIGATVISRNITENKLSEQKLIEIHKEIADYKLMALRSAMNPHFIFNSLNSIQYFIAKNDKRLALDYLSIFSTLIRKILNSAVNNLIPLETEIEILHNYITLEKLRFEDKFNYSIDISPEVDIDYLEIPSMLIQPYVENSILHGLTNKDNNGFLQIKIDQQEDFLLVTIEDDGIGRQRAQEIKANQNIKEKSYGMLVTKERLDIINRTANVSVKIDDLVSEILEPTGTRVTLTIKI